VKERRIQAHASRAQLPSQHFVTELAQAPEDMLRLVVPLRAGTITTDILSRYLRSSTPQVHPSE
jgi:hypothetical protein